MESILIPSQLFKHINIIIWHNLKDFEKVLKIWLGVVWIVLSILDGVLLARAQHDRGTSLSKVRLLSHLALDRLVQSISITLLSTWLCLLPLNLSIDEVLPLFDLIIFFFAMNTFKPHRAFIKDELSLCNWFPFVWRCDIRILRALNVSHFCYGGELGSTVFGCVEPWRINSGFGLSKAGTRGMGISELVDKKKLELEDIVRATRYFGELYSNSQTLHLQWPNGWHKFKVKPTSV